MKFYEPDLKYIGTGEYGPEMLEADDGEWATRADAEQMEKERNAYRDECISRGGRELQALCEKEQAAKDAVEMALLAQEILMRFYQKLMYPGDQKMIEAACQLDVEYQEAQTIIERYEGGTGNG